MDKSFNPQDFETRWYAQWEQSGCFKPSGQGPAYTILLPPPNVTGTLHMGHAFQHTLMDTLVRYHRMRGFDTLWQMGTDHAGIATEMVVSRNLAREGKGETRDSLGRDAFIAKVWEWKQESGDTIERQMRRLGTSGDWSRSTFTMDAQPSAAVLEAFVRLHEQGLIYRGQKLVNWDPVLKTAISDLEVVSEEEEGRLWSIRYPLANGARYDYIERDEDGNETLRETRDYLIVATTRPETMLGDTAVMVHPEDERYLSLIGKTVRLPLSDREIPIIADSYVDKAFGTGCVKVTPAHDFNDYAVGQRHGLPMINILTPDARINENSPAKYQGLDRFDARKAVLADLDAEGWLVEEKKHKLMVPRGDRTGQIIEPYLTDQWFVKMDQMGQRGLQLVESGQVQFVPPNWINTYRHWMENIQDWCISRQLWWGHRIPAWYDESGRVYVARNEDEARAQANTAGCGGSLRQDSDVLETWFSSALWPFSTMGWPNAEAMAERGFDRYVPSSVLVTGFDIIFFWVARMVMMTDHFTAQVPFKHVYITGLVRDRDGQKMSKSKGNVLDPIDLIDGIALDDLVAKRTAGLMQPQMEAKIEKATRKEYPDGIPAFGADALRFTFASLATHGRDIKFDLQRCEGYKNFCNKLWNAARFALMNCEDVSFSGQPPAQSDAERWILARLDRMLAEVHTQFDAYRFDLASQALYEFTWNEFCDWFLEFAKPAFGSDDHALAQSTRHTLLHVLETLLRALHPLIPFVTEEIWQYVAPKLGRAAASISSQAYPQPSETDYRSAEADIEWLKRIVSSLRQIRSELGLSPGRAVSLRLLGDAPSDRSRLDRFRAQIAFLCRLDSLEWLSSETDIPAAAPAVVGDLRLFIPLEGLVDLGAERTRLDKEIKRIEVEIAKCQGKLGNDNFVANAPEDVVAQERQRLSDFSTQLGGLRQQRERLG
ncbi:MAG: Valine--tRNA ligase [Alphaproteobacteria bacterium ADurb.BinA280]|jgi:valyl-tRNA synthetase|nr:MAG: Valine--tRNA ligase [Alphaproteobacteria bacterium ADurb.BinA280]